MGEVLNEVALREGDSVLSSLLHEKLGNTPPAVGPLPSVAIKTVRDWEEILLSTLALRTGLLRRTLLFSTRAMTFWSSSLLGFLVPDREARFFKRGTPDSFVSLQSAPFVTLEVMIEWMRRLFEIASRHPELEASEKQDLAWLEQLMVDIESGLASGARWKRGGQKKPIRVPLTPTAYARLEYWFSSWKNEKKSAG